MIKKEDGRELLNMIPNIYEVESLIPIDELTGEENYNMGDIIYVKSENRIYQYMIFEYSEKEDDIKLVFKDMIKDLERENGELMGNSEFIDKMNEFRNNFENIVETSESNNLGYYLKKIDEALESEELTAIERNRLKNKKIAIFDSTDLLYLNGVSKEYRFDKKKFNKYRMEANAKLKANTLLSFPPLDKELIECLNIINDNEKENKMFLLHFYKYICNSKLNVMGLTVYFTIINILGLKCKNNDLRDMLTHNLREQIKHFNK